MLNKRSEVRGVNDANVTSNGAISKDLLQLRATLLNMIFCLFLDYISC